MRYLTDRRVRVRVAVSCLQRTILNSVTKIQQNKFLCDRVHEATDSYMFATQFNNTRRYLLLRRYYVITMSD